MPPKEKLYDKLFNAVGVDQNKMSVKLTQAPPIKNESKFRVLMSGIMLQADLIYMPEDDGYNYVLTVVDVASRAIDAEPLERKEQNDTIQGFERIFKRKYINKDKVKYIYTDPGTEFKNDAFHKYARDMGIIVRHTMTARKNQMGVVEYYNGVITKVLGTKMTAEEIETSNINHEWVEPLKLLIAELNKDKRELKIKEFFKNPIIHKGEKLLKEGDYVHLRLQQPKSSITDERLHGGFRHGDRKFEIRVRKILDVAIYPSQPVRYMLEGINNASFLRSELLLADESEIGQMREKERKDAEEKRMIEEEERRRRDNFRGLNVMQLRNRNVMMD